MATPEIVDLTGDDDDEDVRAVPLPAPDRRAPKRPRVAASAAWSGGGYPSEQHTSAVQAHTACADADGAYPDRWADIYGTLMSCATPATLHWKHAQRRAEEQLHPQQRPPVTGHDGPQAAELRLGSQWRQQRQNSPAMKSQPPTEEQSSRAPMQTWRGCANGSGSAPADAAPSGSADLRLEPRLMTAPTGNAPATFRGGPSCDRKPRTRNHACAPAPLAPPAVAPVDLTDDAAMDLLEVQAIEAACAASAAQQKVVDVTDLAASQPSATASVDVSDAQAELESARAQVAQLQAQMQAMEDERKAAAAVGAPLAPRPEHWSPAKDPAVLAEYVTLDLGGQGRQGEEVETVLQAAERCRAVSRARVVQIDRVQNLRLWTKYIIRRNEVVELAGESRSAERLLFHGSNPATLALITREGFDIRVSNMGGALGAGTYFAEHLSYSLGYVNRGSAGVQRSYPQHAPTTRRTPAGPQVSKSEEKKVQRDLQQMLAQQAAALRRVRKATGRLTDAKSVYNAAATQYNAAVARHNQCAADRSAAMYGWDSSSSQQQLADQHALLQQQQAELRRLETTAGACKEDAKWAARHVQEAQKRADEVKRRAAAALQAQQAAGLALAVASMPQETGQQHPGEQAASRVGRQASTLASPRDGTIMVTLCRVTLGRSVPGAPSMRRPPDNADSTSGSHIYAVYDNAQAYPEYVLWLTP